MMSEVSCKCPKKYMNGSLESSLYIKLDPLARRMDR